jgi:hypothetical protein
MWNEDKNLKLTRHRTTVETFCYALAFYSVMRNDQLGLSQGKEVEIVPRELSS